MVKKRSIVTQRQFEAFKRGEFEGFTDEQIKECDRRLLLAKDKEPKDSRKFFPKLEEKEVAENE